MRSLMQRVADRSSRPDVKVMALFIREKLAGANRAASWQQGAKISADLNILSPDKAATTRELSKCECTMTRGMRCQCSVFKCVQQISGSANGQEAKKDKTRVRRKEVGEVVAGTSKPGRRKFGSLLLDPQHVADKVAEMGGLEVIEGQQGRKGGGWKTVASALGVDVEVFRDCGFQVLHVAVSQCMLQCLSVNVCRSTCCSFTVRVAVRRSQYVLQCVLQSRSACCSASESVCVVVRFFRDSSFQVLHGAVSQCVLQCLSINVCCSTCCRVAVRVAVCRSLLHFSLSRLLLSGTAFCIWSVISSISNCNRCSSSVCLFCHVLLKRDQGD